MVVRFVVIFPFALSLQCWEGTSTESEVFSLGPPFAEGMHEVNCSGACYLLSDHCDSNAAAITVARCTDTCPSVLSSCEMCCHSNLCNSRNALSSLELGSPLTVFSLSRNANQIGISGSSVGQDLCATLVLTEPPQAGCISGLNSSVYVAVNQGSGNCGWTEGNAALLSASGCWRNLQGASPEISINATVSSDIFTGKLQYQTSTLAHLVASKPVLDISSAGRVPKRFKVTTGKPNDEAKLTMIDKSLIVELNSPFGIGRATVTKIKGAWPQHVIVLLDLRGLEKFQVSNGSLTLHASVSSESTRLWANDAELEALPAPLRMSIAVVDENNENASTPYRFPLAAGLRFQVTLPSILFAPSVSSLALEWIDFYR